MKSVFCVLGCCALLAGMAVAADQDSFQGSWKLYAAFRDGKPLTGAELAATLKIEGNRFTFAGGQAGVSGSGTFQLNEAATPKAVDLVHEDGPDQGKTSAGIYDIRAGNRFRLCLAPAGAPRPSKFESKPGSGYLFQEWLRVK
jgi:uncharacterized protein (TIGR03067 family)